MLVNQVIKFYQLNFFFRLYFFIWIIEFLSIGCIFRFVYCLAQVVSQNPFRLCFLRTKYETDEND